MAVLKNTTQGNYTIVSQNIMKNKNLSLNERGMLLTLLSLPDNWHLTIAGLCQILPDGKDKVSKTLNSLISKGYVTREQNRESRGKFGSTNLEVHESPIMTSDEAKESDTINDYSHATTNISPYPENPDTVKQETEYPYSESHPQYINNISSNHKVINKGVCNTDTLTDSDYMDLVSEFGKSIVDYQIKRITSHGYKGCCNPDTIRTWCRERLNRSDITKSAQPKNFTFSNFSQRNYDYAALEREALGFSTHLTTDCPESTA